MKTCLAPALLTLLAACGGTSITIGGGGGSAQYADTTADTYANRIADGGGSGKIAYQAASGAIQRGDIHVELSDDFQTAYITFGGTTYTLQAAPSPAPPATAAGGLYANLSTGTTASMVGGFGGDYTGAMYFAQSGNTGFVPVMFGLETRPENLPTTATSYSGLYQYGNFSPNGATLVGTGFVDFNVNFAAASDQVDATFTEDVGGSIVFGTMTASISGNGFSGTMTVPGSHADLSGSLTIDGTFYGPGAEQVAGAMSGSLTHDTQGSANVVGIFEAD